MKRSVPLITEHQLLDLESHLEQFISFGEDPVRVIGCDYTLNKTIAWLKAHNLDQESWVNYLQHHGGKCDCTVLMNVTYRIDDDDLDFVSSEQGA